MQLDAVGELFLAAGERGMAGQARVFPYRVGRKKPSRFLRASPLSWLPCSPKTKDR